MKRPKSEDVYKHLRAVMPGGVSSPVRSFKSLNMSPIVAKKAFKQHLWDEDGNRYIDFCMSWGAMILGHAQPFVVEAIQKAAFDGTSYGMTTSREGQLANCIIDRVRSVEKVRFLSSGTESVMTAIRLARGYTGRDLIIKFDGNYHGHHDSFLIKSGSYLNHMGSEASSLGVTHAVAKSTISLPYGDEEALKEAMHKYQGRIAAVVVEPVAGNMGVVNPGKAFLELLSQLTQKDGSLLIFDEVMTGFRIARGGACELFDIDADLTCFAKVLGGGMPLSALGGKAEVMNHLAPLGSVYQAGTLSGNPLCTAAGLATFTEIDRDSVFYQKLHQKSHVLASAIENWSQSHPGYVTVNQVGSMLTLFFGVNQVTSYSDVQAMNTSIFEQYFKHMLENGVLIPPSPYEAWFVADAHTASDMDLVTRLTLDFLNDLVKNSRSSAIVANVVS